MDHLIRCNVHWGELLNYVEQEQTPLTWTKLKASPITESSYGFSCDLMSVSRTLWSFIGEHMSTALFDRRTAMASGEERNGIELWRRLFRTHEGGDAAVRIGGVANLHTFPPCARVDELSSWLAEWNQCRLANGKGLDDLNLKNPFKKESPAALRPISLELSIE